MKIEIEEYKGQTIKYDDDTDKFICDISIEDNFKSSKRGSLKDIRKEIDQFIKLNLEFKPFRVFVKSYDDFGVATVEAIRTDGKLVVKGAGYKTLYGKDDIKDLFKFDHELNESNNKISDEFKKAVDKRQNDRKQLMQKLAPIDLSKYELS
jgi:hypothetical protein